MSTLAGSRLVSSTIVALVAAGVFAAARQQSPTAPDQQKPPTFQAGVNLVRVDVHATAADGTLVSDLAKADFEIREDGVPQDIRTFELVSIAGNSSRATPIQPRSVRDANQMVTTNQRARLFVVFLDTYHLHPISVHHIRGALVRLLDRMLDPEDMVAVMTPEMSGASLAFGRGSGNVAALLERWQPLGRRHGELNRDPIEERYYTCYSPYAPDLVQPMIDRRREKLTLDALDDLVGQLEGLRDERKAVLMVTEGWMLYGPNESLARPIHNQVPRPATRASLPQPDPAVRDGSVIGDLRVCDADRLRLAREDHDRQFRDFLDVANRANTTFYSIDPRGLPVFDNDIEEEVRALPAERTGALSTGRDVLTTAQNSMKTLAVNTDGFAVMNDNDLDRNLRRISDDLSAYYLLGYSSTNTKLDGKFRSISVSVKRPGVTVRARRGYRAATKEEIEARAATAAPRGVTPVGAAVNALSVLRDDQAVRLSAGHEWQLEPDGRLRPSLWLVSELDPAAGTRDPAWKDGAEVVFAVLNADKQIVVTEQKAMLSRDARSFRWALPPDQALPPGEYAVRLTSKPAGTTLGTTETLRVLLPATPASGELAVAAPMLSRRGPFTGPRWMPSSDPRYRRQERVKVEVPVVGTLTDASVRLLDRAGNPMTTIPVVVNRRTENGIEIVSGEVVLSPLTTGDYVLETTVTRGEKTQKVVVGIRIIP